MGQRLVMIKKKMFKQCYSLEFAWGVAIWSNYVIKIANKQGIVNRKSIMIGRVYIMMRAIIKSVSEPRVKLRNGKAKEANAE